MLGSPPQQEGRKQVEFAEGRLLMQMSHFALVPPDVKPSQHRLRGARPPFQSWSHTERRARVRDVWNKADDSTRCEESDSLRLLDGFGWLCLYYLSSRCDSSVRDVNKRKSWQSAAETHEVLMHLWFSFFMLFMSYLRHSDSENTACFSHSALTVHNVFFLSWLYCLFKTESAHLHDFMFKRT